MSDKSKEQSLEQLAEAVAAVNRTSKLLRLSISELTQVRQTEAVSSDDLAKNWSHGEVLELVAGSIESLKVSDTKPALIGARLTPITFDDTFRWIPPEEETDAGWTKTAMDALKQAVDAATVWVQTNSGPTSTTPPADTAPDDTAPPEQDGGVMVNPEFIGDAAAEASPATKSDTFGFDKIYQKDQSPGSEDGIGNVLFDPNQKSTNVDNNVIQRQSIDVISNLGETAGQAVDTTMNFLEAAKKTGLNPDGAPARLGTLSTAISVVNSYEKSNSSGEFIYLVGRDAAFGYASTVAASATAGALKGSFLGPWGATAAGVGTGAVTAFALSNAEESVRATVGEVGRTFSYRAMHYEIWNLYMGYGH